jgi:hypothetical protein
VNPLFLITSVQDLRCAGRARACRRYPMPRSRPVHLLLSDGTMLCRGLELFSQAKPLDQGPPVITLDAGCVTCPTCLLQLEKRRAVA